MSTTAKMRVAVWPLAVTEQHGVWHCRTPVALTGSPCSGSPCSLRSRGVISKVIKLLQWHFRLEGAQVRQRDARDRAVNKESVSCCAVMRRRGQAVMPWTALTSDIDDAVRIKVSRSVDGAVTWHPRRDSQVFGMFLSKHCLIHWLGRTKNPR